MSLNTSLTILFYLFILLPIILSKFCSVVITGSTGVLGQALTKYFCELDYQVYAGYRDIDKAQSFLSTIRHSKLKNTPQFFEHSVGNQLGSTSLPGFGKCSSFSHRILINNAAVSIKGSSKDIMAKTMLVNVLSPISLTEFILEESREFQGKTSVINISSGDGELLYLNPNIAEIIKSIDNMESLKQYMNELIISFNPTVEYAFGDTPLYSLSKSLLNKATIIQQKEFKDPLKFRVLSCCPGNFLSPISAEEEKESSLPVDDVAQMVGEVCVGFEKFSGGKFYRFKEEIGF